MYLRNSVQILTMPHEEDEAGNHEDGMEVELLAHLVPPAEPIPVQLNPDQGKDQHAKQQHLAQEDEEIEGVARNFRHLSQSISVLLT